MLVDLGRASKNQSDSLMFYDSERWKEEGQLESFKSYLKCKEDQLSIAKINGNLKDYEKLSNFSRTLDKELVKNPCLLPMLAKVVLVHSHKESSRSIAFNKKSSPLSPPFVKLPPLLIYSSSKDTGFNTFSQSSNDTSSNELPFLTSVSESSANQAKEFRQFKKANRTMSINMKDLNAAIDETIKTTSRIDENSSQIYSLFEMTNGKNVENYIESKSDLSSNLIFETGAISRRYGEMQEKNYSNAINDMFMAAALQSTKNYRMGVKHKVPILIKGTQKKKSKTLSTLAIIREESRNQDKKKRRKSNKTNKMIEYENKKFKFVNNKLTITA
jgi:hypothetical protein